jgi:hypothetical protein
MSITTVGFGIKGNLALETVLKSIAWPTSESYYDVESSPQRLKDVFSAIIRKFSDRIPILFGPVRNSRDELAGPPIPVVVGFTRGGTVAKTREQTWNPPAVGVPVAEITCSKAELDAIINQPPPVTPQFDLPIRRLMIFGMFVLVLVALWFAAPRFVWPEAYIPRPTIPQIPSVPTVAGGAVQLQQPGGPQFRGPQLQQPTFDPQARSTPAPRPQPGGGGGGGAYARPQPGGGGGGGDQTVYVPARPPGPARPSIASTPRAPRPAEPPASHPGDDATVYKPIDTIPKRDR